METKKRFVKLYSTSLPLLALLLLITAGKGLNSRPENQENIFYSNNRMLISALNMYVAEYGGEQPKTMDDITVYLHNPDQTLSVPEGATYELIIDADGQARINSTWNEEVLTYSYND